MKPNIIFLISTLSAGGAQRVVSNLTFGLSDRYSIALALHNGEEIGYEYKANLIDLKIPVSTNYIMKFINVFRRASKMREIKKSLLPFATISFLEGSNYVNILAQGKGKTIISVRNYKSKQANGLLGYLGSFMMKKLYDRSDCIIAPSRGIRKDLIRSFQIDESLIKVIYNPYDVEKIQRYAAEVIDPAHSDIFTDPVIITVGSFLRQKGQWHLIRAFKEVLKEFPNLKLVILGKGGLEQYLRKLIQDNDLLRSVFLLGFQDNPYKYISKSSVFVFPSLFEGFPNALVESMACGTPVISSDCRSGPREILAPETNFDFETEVIEYADFGLLTPVCDGRFHDAGTPLTKEEKVLAEAIVKLFSNKAMLAHYKNRGIERAKHFTLEDISKQWIRVIDE